jgi:hypothetical protein
MRLIKVFNLFIYIKSKIMGVGKWIKKGAVSFVMATGGVEKNALGQSGEDSDAGQLSAIPMGQNQLMRDLKEGRLTQQVKQFRKHHYEVLQASEKYKAKWGKDGDFKMLTEEEIVSNRTAQGDPYDNYKVEVTIDNVAISKSLLEFEEKDMVRPIKVNRNVPSQCKIEESATKLHVRDIDGTRKLLDFYIDDSPENRRAVLEARGLMSNPGITDFNNITNVNFTTPGGNMMMFEYKVLAFDKVVEYNGSFIVKMFAECTKNGEWAAEKYMIID